MAASRFDRAASLARPEIGLLEFHTQFDGDMGRLLQFLQTSNVACSISADIFNNDSLKAAVWLTLNTKGTIKLVKPDPQPSSSSHSSRGGVTGVTGAFKTTRLSRVRARFPESEIREISAHQLIRGDLGETQRRLSAVFESADKKFPIVIWDDIDLTLNTEGRIVREILVDLPRLLQNFQGLFVFSAESRKTVPETLAHFVTDWEDGPLVGE